MNLEQAQAKGYPLIYLVEYDLIGLDWLANKRQTEHEKANPDYKTKDGDLRAHLVGVYGEGGVSKDAGIDFPATVNTYAVPDLYKAEVRSRDVDARKSGEEVDDGLCFPIKFTDPNDAVVISADVSIKDKWVVILGFRHIGSLRDMFQRLKSLSESKNSDNAVLEKFFLIQEKNNNDKIEFMASRKTLEPIEYLNKEMLRKSRKDEEIELLKKQFLDQQNMSEELKCKVKEFERNEKENFKQVDEFFKKSNSEAEKLLKKKLTKTN